MAAVRFCADGCRMIRKHPEAVDVKRSLAPAIVLSESSVTLEVAFSPITIATGQSHRAIADKKQLSVSFQFHQNGLLYMYEFNDLYSVCVDE